MADVGALSMMISASTGPLAAGLGKAAGLVSGFAGKAAGILGGIGSAILNPFTLAISALTGALSVAGLAAMFQGVVEELNHFGQAATQVGATLEGLSGLKLLAENNDVAFEGVIASLNRMNNLIGEARSGSEQASRSFARLGIDADQLAGVPAEEAFARIADAIGALPDASLRANAAMSIFGRQGAQLVRLMAEGGDGIRNAAAEAQRLGLSVSEFDMEGVARADDALDEFSNILAGIRRTFVLEILPVVSEIMEEFRSASADVDWAETVRQTFRWVAEAIARVVDLFRELAPGVARMSVMITEAIAGMMQSLGEALGTMSDLPDVLGGAEFGEASNRALDLAQNIRVANRDTEAMAQNIAAWPPALQAVQDFFGRMDEARARGAGPEAARLRAERAAAERVFRLYEESQKVLERLESPMDKLREEGRQIQDMFDAGLLSADQQAQALGEAANRLLPQGHAIQFAGALEQGSTAAASTIAKFMAQQQGRESPQERIRRVVEQQLRVQEQQRDDGRRVLEELRRGPVVRAAGL